MQPKPLNPEPDDDAFDAIERMAADWLARREFGLSPAEHSELEAWLQADLRHARALEELEKTSHVLDRWPEILPKAFVPLHPSRKLSELRFRLTRMLPLAGTAAAAAIVVVGSFTWQKVSNDRSHYRMAVATEIGGLRSIKLPDGSSVQLNTDSDVNVQFSNFERRVQLVRGEASFTVAKEKSRPFFVDAGGVSVRAVGTEFNVRLHPESVEVMVMEGRVRVDNLAQGGSLLASSEASPVAPSPEPVLSAGHRVVVPVSDAASLSPVRAQVMAPAQIERVLAWQDRRLHFEATPLFEVVAEFNRYNRHKLVIEDPALARQKFGGTFRPERYETLISLLEQSFDVVADRGESATVLRHRGN